MALTALAISNRIAADTGTGGLVNSGTPLLWSTTLGWNYGEAPVIDSESTAYPAIFYHSPGGAKNISGIKGGVRTFSWERTWLFDIYVEKFKNVATAQSPLTVGAAIMERLRGDWEVQTSSPSYGFDGFAPSISGWGADIFELIDSGDEHSDDLYHWTMAFRIITSKAGT
jgi:hypothetical protein